MTGRARDRCVSSEDLFFFSEGLLEHDEHRRVRDHLASCAACAAAYDAEAELTVSLRSLPAPLPTPGFAAGVVGALRRANAYRVSPRWWFAAAVLLMGSGARWLFAEDLSMTGAIDTVGATARTWGIALLELVRALSDLRTWLHALEAFEVLARAMASSPTLGIMWAAAFLTVATAANLLLWSLARRYVAV